MANPNCDTNDKIFSEVHAVLNNEWKIKHSDRLCDTLAEIENNCNVKIFFVNGAYEFRGTLDQVNSVLERLSCIDSLEQQTITKDIQCPSVSNECVTTEQVTDMHEASAANTLSSDHSTAEGNNSEITDQDRAQKLGNEVTQQEEHRTEHDTACLENNDNPDSSIKQNLKNDDSGHTADATNTQSDSLSSTETDACSDDDGDENNQMNDEAPAAVQVIQ